MEKTLKVIKINILSLIALPLLLLSTICKLFSKGLEKIATICSLFLMSLTLIMTIEAFRDLETGLMVFLIIVAIFIIGITYFCIAYLILHFAYRFVNFLYYILLSLFEQLYFFFYTLYTTLYEHCQEDYRYINFTGNKICNRFLCLFYSLLHGVNWLIASILSLILPISFILSIAWIIWSLFDLNHSLYQSFGMNLFQILPHFNKYALVCDIITYLISASFISTLLITLGSEWSEYAKELKMNSTNYSSQLDVIRKNAFQTSEDDLTEMDTNRMYIEKLSQHINNIETISADVDCLLEQKEHNLLRSCFATYFCNISQIVEICNSYQYKVPPKKFKTLIPQIQQLDKQYSELEKLVSKLKEDYKNPFQSTVFFSGCNSPEKLEKRYKSLCKAYHPDVSGGDEESFKKMQAEYDTLKSTFA